MLQGYSRKGSALYKLDRLKEAEETYKEGLQHDPNNESLKQGLEEILSRKSKQHNIDLTIILPWVIN